MSRCTRRNCLDETHHRLGKLAYEAYRTSSNGKSLVSGSELPAWESLRSDIREAWHAAADAVANDRSTLLASRGAL